MVRHHGVSGLTHLVLFHATLGIRGDETGVFFRFLPRIVRDMFRGVDVETKVDLEGFKEKEPEKKNKDPKLFQTPKTTVWVGSDQVHLNYAL